MQAVVESDRLPASSPDPPAECIVGCILVPLYHCQNIHNVVSKAERRPMLAAKHSGFGMSYMKHCHRTAIKSAPHLERLRSTNVIRRRIKRGEEISSIPTIEIPPVSPHGQVRSAAMQLSATQRIIYDFPASTASHITLRCLPVET